MRQHYAGLPVDVLGGTEHSLVLRPGQMTQFVAPLFKPLCVSRLRLRGESGLIVSSARLGTMCLEAGRAAGLALTPDGIVWRFPEQQLSAGSELSVLIFNKAAEPRELLEAIWWGIPARRVRGRP